MARSPAHHPTATAYLAARAAGCRPPALNAFYQPTWPTTDPPSRDVEFMALDIETTGLNPKRHAIVSIGMIPFTLTRIRSDLAWHQVVRPPGDLVPESVTFHHITHTDIREAPRFGQIMNEFLERLAGKIAVVHYRPIERSFLDAAVRHQCDEGLQFPLIDTMEIEAALHPTRKAGWLSRLFGKKPISIRLDDSRSRYNLPSYMAHHALTDALATAELLQAQVATHYAPENPVGSLWL